MNYRREIDGLRALAVIPVILFHAGFGLFSGGYVGVDIFFVISGYLITSIILTDLTNQNFSILHFYERRARRILPGPTVEYIKPLPIILAQSDGAFTKGIYKHSQFVIEKRFKVSNELSDILKPAGVFYADISSAVCDKDICRTMGENGEPMSFDYGHFTLSGSKIVVANLKPYMCQDLGLQKHFCSRL